METTLKPWLFQPTLSILFNVVTDSFLTQKLSYHGSQVEIESLDDEKLEERISYYVANKSIISVIVDNFFLRHCMKIHILYSFQHVWNWRIDVTRKMANVLSSKDIYTSKYGFNCFSWKWTYHQSSQRFYLENLGIQSQVNSNLSIRLL